MNKKIYKEYTTNISLSQIICLALLFLMLSHGSSWARPDTKTGSDQSDMSKGNIDYIHEDNTIVINDMIFFIDKDTKYFALSGNSIAKSQLNEGDIVSFKSSKEQLLKELYVTKKTEQKEQTASPAPEASSQNMYLENGIWKNQ